MNRIRQDVVQEAPSELMGILAIMGFSAEGNLRDVAQALGKRNPAGLDEVAERNARQSRLRAEIDEQVVEKMAQSMVDAHERRKLVLVSQAALMFERMGAQTVEIAQLCGQILREPKPSRFVEIKKLIEHAVYIADRAATGLVEERVDIARVACEQYRAASELNGRINHDLTPLIEAGGDGAVRAGILQRIADKAHGIIEEAGQLAKDVVVFLEKPEL